MSFASDTKNELARLEPSKKCCMLAEISAFLRVAGSIGLAGFGKFKVTVTTENAAVARHYKKLLQEYFSIESALEISESNAIGKNKESHKYSYSLTIDANNRSEQILRECGILLIKEGNNYISDGIYDGIIRSKCCRKAYLRGVFMACGTMSNPEKSYDMEFVLASENMANDLKKMINSFVDLSCKIVKRGRKYVVYMKRADYISDTLAILGANSQMLVFEDIRIKKSLVNSAKRSVNCDNANFDRAIDAAMRQVEAINKIVNKIGWDQIPPKLREVAEHRLEHPDYSISALGELCNPPLKKSGINNRLKKLEELANQL